MILGLPIWLIALVRVPKLRAGLGQKFGFWPETLLSRIQTLPENRIWLHAVSVGELNAARPLIAELKAKGFSLVISNTTATGHRLALESFPELPAFYFPFDFPWIIHAVIRRIQPKAILIMETEIWPNLLGVCGNRNIPVFLVNGRMSEKAKNGYGPYRFLFQHVFSRYRAIMMQAKTDARHITEIGAPTQIVTVTGNVKFDIEPFNAQNEVSCLKQLLGLNDTPVLTIASTHAGEEEGALSLFTALHAEFKDLKLILAPRHPERFDAIEGLLMEQQLSYVRRSQLASPIPDETRIILLDTIGELRTVYALSTLAILGGSFVPVGGHNPLEAVVESIPVVFGPHMNNFKEIARLLTRENAGLQVENWDTAMSACQNLLTDPALYQQMTSSGKTCIQNNQGAVKASIQTILSNL